MATNGGGGTGSGQELVPVFAALKSFDEFAREFCKDYHLTHPAALGALAPRSRPKQTDAGEDAPRSRLVRCSYHYFYHQIVHRHREACPLKQIRENAFEKLHEDGILTRQKLDRLKEAWVSGWAKTPFAVNVLGQGVNGGNVNHDGSGSGGGGEVGGNVAGGVVEPMPGEEEAKKVMMSWTAPGSSGNGNSSGGLNGSGVASTPHMPFGNTGAARNASSSSSTPSPSPAVGVNVYAQNYAGGGGGPANPRPNSNAVGPGPGNGSGVFGTVDPRQTLRYPGSSDYQQGQGGSNGGNGEHSRDSVRSPSPQHQSRSIPVAAGLIPIEETNMDQDHQPGYQHGQHQQQDQAHPDLSSSSNNPAITDINVHSTTPPSLAGLTTPNLPSSVGSPRKRGPGRPPGSSKHLLASGGASRSRRRSSYQKKNSVVSSNGVTGPGLTGGSPLTSPTTGGRAGTSGGSMMHPDALTGHGSFGSGRGDFTMSPMTTPQPLHHSQSHMPIASLCKSSTLVEMNGVAYERFCPCSGYVCKTGTSTSGSGSAGVPNSIEGGGEGSSVNGAMMQTTEGNVCKCEHADWMHGGRDGDAQSSFRKVGGQGQVDGSGTGGPGDGGNTRKRKRGTETNRPPVMFTDDDGNPIPHQKLDREDRLTWEYDSWCRNPLKGFHVRPTPPELAHLDPDWESSWQCGIPGPAGTEWAGGVFKMKILFPSSYPDSPPTCLFSPNFYHCNIYANGKVCTLNSRMRFMSETAWSKETTMLDVLSSVQRLLSNPDLEECVQVEPANAAKTQPLMYQARVREFAKANVPFW